MAFHPLIETPFLIVWSLYLTFRNIVLNFVIPRSYRQVKNIDGQVALITGGGSGIGRRTAILLAKRGCKVVTWDINKEGNQETVQLIKRAGGSAVGYTCNLCDAKDVYRTAKKVKAEVGEVDILVNNAGIVVGKLLNDTSDEEIQRTFQVNVFAHFWTCKAFLPSMMERDRGHIVTIASLAGHSGIKKMVDYCSSKFAAVGFDLALTNEIESFSKNIVTTVVSPFYINTGMFAGVQGSPFMAMLEQDYVAQEIDWAIVTNQRELLLPRYSIILILLLKIMPQEVIFRAMKLFHFTDFMDDFVGRQPLADKKQENKKNNAANELSDDASDDGSDGGSK